MTRHYHVTTSVPGYLPMSDDLYSYPTFKSAVSAAVEEVSYQRAAEDDIPARERRTWHRGSVGRGYGIWRGARPHDDHDLGLIVELTTCHESDCEAPE